MKKLLIIAAISFTAFIVYYLTSGGNTPYNYFIYLSQSFLKGEYWISSPPSWLNELVPDSGRFYVVYPPMPAILLMPFVFIFGASFPQQFLAHLLGAGLTIKIFKISQSIKKDLSLSIWAAIFIGFGSIVWYLSSSGSAWYLGQISAAFFLSSALEESLNKKRTAFVGLFLGASYLSRLQTILSLPLFLYLLKDKIKKPGNLVIFFLALSIFILFNFTYNFVRFGTIFDKAYYLIPGVLNEPWYKEGIFNISNITRHLKVIFLSFPKFSFNPPYVEPSWAGLSIWITTPAFIYSLKAPLKENVVKYAWLAIFLISIPILTHGTTGFAQFGYRFAVDFYPILSFLTIKGISKKGLRWHHWLLLFIGILVNFWGVLWINKFGWVEF